MRPKVGHWSEIQEETVSSAKGLYRRWLITPRDGAPNFAMRLFRMVPGGETPPHSHDWEHEVFILSGRGRAILDGEEHELAPGTFLFIPGGVEHAFRNDGREDLVFLCLIPASAVPPGK